MARFFDPIADRYVDHDFGGKKPSPPVIVTPPGPVNGYCAMNGHNWALGPICLRCGVYQIKVKP